MLKEYTLLFIPILIAIVFGEVLFQNNRHMVMKWRTSVQGVLNCLEHSLIYTLFVGAALYLFSDVNVVSLQLFTSVLFSHFIIESLCIHNHWMKFIKGEESPILHYYIQKISKKYDAPVNNMVFLKYIEENPILEVDENLINGNSFFVMETYVVSIALHFIVTSSVVIALAFYGWI